MTPSSIERPLLRLEPGRHKRALAGHPWVYSNEIAMGAAVKALAPGTLVALESSEGRTLGTASFNPHTLIAARILDPDPAARIDAEFFARRFVRAGALRDRLYGAPFYRLVHAEADGLGGLVVDRYGETVVVQITTAGMNRLAGDIRAGLAATLAPRTIIVRRAFRPWRSARNIWCFCPSSSVSLGMTPSREGLREIFRSSSLEHRAASVLCPWLGLC